MKYVDEEYLRWIEFAVAPRDIIVHYNALDITYHFDSALYTSGPVHTNCRLIKGTDAETNILSYSYPDINEFVKFFYSFYNKALYDLLCKSLLVSNARI